MIPPFRYRSNKRNVRCAGTRLFSHGETRIQTVVIRSTDTPMNPYWSRIAQELSPYVPGEQPRIANLVKLNTNESPFGPSPRALEAMQAAASDTLRLYPDPEATELRQALAAHHGVAPEQLFVGNGSDEVIAQAFAALLKQPGPLLFPDVTYSFY